jgi:nucleoside-diphosphate-sugar epimerase
MKRVLVTGGTGFIGHHLIRRLKREGYWVRGVDYAPIRKGMTNEADELLLLDLRDWRNALTAALGMDWVFNLAADMGGAGFVFTGHDDVEITRNNALINVNMLEAARRAGIKRYFFSSSACTYPRSLQTKKNARPLKESDAYPANPDSPYGWEKIYAEQLCGAYAREAGLDVRIARFFNIMGEECSWNNGREKAPAAASRKVAYAKFTGSPVEVWGTGKQVRSFLYVFDLVDAILEFMRGDHPGPINLGSAHCVTIDDIYKMVMKVAGVEIKLNHVEGPIGVDVRIPDLSLAKDVLDFVPRMPLGVGLARVYEWVETQVKEEIGWKPPS